MLKTLYKCFPLPWLIFGLVFLLLLWLFPFYHVWFLEQNGSLGLNRALEIFLSLLITVLNVFIFRQMVSVSAIMETGERLSVYPMTLLSALCFLMADGVLAVVGISFLLLLLLRLMNGLSSGNIKGAAFDCGLLTALAITFNPIYGFYLIIFMSIAFIHAQLNLKAALISLLGLSIPFLLYAQIAFLLDDQMLPQHLFEAKTVASGATPDSFLLLPFLIILSSVILYTCYRSFTMLNTGPVRRRMMIRSGFVVVMIGIGIGLISSVSGYGNSAFMVVIPGLCILFLEFLRHPKGRWEPYLFLAWALMTWAFIWTF
ncbi:MAG: hypothetical protein O2867_02515 [Bacteroidetes bacterium]|nr:hypothetical protein [Bacteroidota bacterium]